MTMQHTTDVYDVAVIGVGTMGSMALWQLTRMRTESDTPLRVIGIEQYGAVHAEGAFSGESRLFRVAAKEGKLFVPALQRARSQWLELGRIAGRDLFVPAGVLHVAPGDHPDLAATLSAVEEYDLPHRVLNADELRMQYPQFSIEDQDVGVLDELAGALRPESAVFAASRAAIAAGAEIRYNTTVSSIDASNDVVTVETSAGTIRAHRVIVTAGPWAAELLPDLQSLVQVKNYTLAWFMPEDISLFQPDRFPGFMRDLDDMHAFGAPTFDGYSVKVSAHLALPDSNEVSERPRTLTREQLRWLGAQAQRVFPSMDPEPVRFSIHPDGQTADSRPILDTVEDGKIVLAAGMSGNGFKFAPVWGEALAQLAVSGESQWRHPEFTFAHHRARAAALVG